MTRPSLVRECEAGCGAKLIFERTVAGKWAPLEHPGEPRSVFLRDECPDCGRPIGDHVQAPELGVVPCDRTFEGREKRSMIGTDGVVVDWTYPAGLPGAYPVRAFVNHFIGCPRKELFRKERPRRQVCR